MMRKQIGKIGAALGVVALAGATASPAAARDTYNDRTENVAGAAILGSLLSILSGGNGYYGDNYRYGDSRYGDYRYDDDYRDGRYNRRYNNTNYNNGRRLVEQCVYNVERAARRYGSNPNVTRIRDVTRYSRGYHVKGQVEIGGRSRWQRNNYAVANFDCQVERGRVVDLDIGRFRN